MFITEYDETTVEPIGLTEVFVKDLEKGRFVMVSDDNGNLINLSNTSIGTASQKIFM